MQCVARAVNVEGDPGREQESEHVTISREEAMCRSREEGIVGAEPYTAKLRYIGNVVVLCRDRTLYSQIENYNILNFIQFDRQPSTEIIYRKILYLHCFYMNHFRPRRQAPP